MMAPGDKLLAVLVLMFMTGIIMGGWWWLLCVPLVLVIAFVVIACVAADRLFRGIRLW